MRLLARISAGLILWAFGFSLLYALQGTGCAYGWEDASLFGTTMLRWILVATWLLLVAACLTLLRLTRAASSDFERRVTLATVLAGAGTMLITGSPVALTSACA
ncbi:MAG: hypothetical protein FD144_746 [Rhodospirillaceae bacterium]|nr:MAG: hypothetical protein FD144_746 [Rhodospirillaceae bacterium]